LLNVGVFTGWANSINPVKPNPIQLKKVGWVGLLGEYEFQNKKSIKKSGFWQNRTQTQKTTDPLIR
jgi:hypothetical protein